MFNPKQVQERVDEIRVAVKKITDANQRPEDALLQVMGHVGELNVVLSERAEIAADKLEKHTIALVHHTRWLKCLTVALLFFALVSIIIDVCKHC